MKHMVPVQTLHVLDLAESQELIEDHEPVLVNEKRWDGVQSFKFVLAVLIVVCIACKEVVQTGNVELADGRWVKGFICEPYGLNGAKNISEFGGWRAYIQSLQATTAKSN